MDSRPWCSFRVLDLAGLRSALTQIDSGDADIRACYHRGGPAIDIGGMLGVLRAIATSSQSVSTRIARSAMAGPSGGDLRRGAPLSLHQSALRSSDFRGTPDGRDAPFWASDRTVAGSSAPPRSFARRRGWRALGRAHLGADEPRHVAAPRVGSASRRDDADTTCPRHRRLGLAAGPSLRHRAGEPRDERSGRSSTRSRGRHRRGLAT